MIYEKLFDWQKKIVDKFSDRSSFGLFLDMGLGKTPISLAFAERNNCTKVLIITINSKAIEDENTNGSWLKWATHSIISYNTFSKKSKQHFFSSLSCDLLILNYESLFMRGNLLERKKKITLKDNIIQFIKSCKDNNVALIIDESHKVKNLQSLQTGAIMQIKKQLLLTAKNVYTYLLTGTPFTTGYIDLYTQLKILGYEGTKSQFINDFCILGNIPGLLGWQQPIVAYKNIDKLFALIHKYAITIKSEDVVQLPEKIFVEHKSKCSLPFLLFTNEFAKGIDILKEDKNELRMLHLHSTKEYDTEIRKNNPYFRNIAYPDLTWTADTNGSFWLRARQLSIGFQGNSDKSLWFDKTRLTQLYTFLQEHEDNYIIFYNYTPELIEIYEICDKLNYNVDVYCGEMKSLTFYNKYTALNDAEKLVSKKNVIIANFASGSTGMNWQEYNKCIIFSMPLYKDYEQGIKRLHRLGQKNTTIYHIFYQSNWLDLSMKKALDNSCQYSQEMFESDLSRVNNLINNV